MGPSWYWMPDALNIFFNAFGKSASDFYTLKKLDPGFPVVFGNREIIPVPSDRDTLRNLFESIEKGVAQNSMRF